MSGVDVLAAVGRIAYALQSSPVVAEVHELRAAVEKLIADRAELLNHRRCDDCPALARALEDAERWRRLVELTRKNWSVTADAPNGLTYQYIGDRLVLAIDAARKKP